MKKQTLKKRITEGKDEVLEKAIELINGNQKNELI